MATSKSDIFNDQDDCNEEESAEDLNYTNVVPIDDPLLKPVKEYIYITIFSAFLNIYLLSILYV